ncbi:MAG: alginate lyase family protein [Burkholderiaceae bacterium]
MTLMHGLALARELPGKPACVGSIFRAPFDAMDDAALLAHWRSPRDVHIDLVVDAEECAPHKIEALMQGRFEFNHELHTLPDPVDWLANPSADVEWHILLHKFYYAPGLGAAFLQTGDADYARRWMQLIDGWMRSVPPGFIAADVTGRRVQNWIYSLRAFADARAVHPDRVAPIDAAFLRRMLESLREQVEFLCTHLTSKRNHRTLELYAIFLAGVALPEMARAAHWRAFALAETLANLRADLLADGVHCELSSDYHHLALRNWLHVRRLAARHGVPVPAEMDALLERALGFCLHVHKPDGVSPSLSDGDARGFLELLAQGAELYGRDDMRWAATRGRAGRPPASTAAHFAASGYTVLRSSWGSGAHDIDQPQYLVLDSGPLGEGNHGHFDCLSFELAAFGRSLVVDPGRYTYSEAGEVNWRVHFRGTAAHNTVCVDGRQQTRYLPKPAPRESRHAAGSMRHKVSGPAPRSGLREAVHGRGFSLLHGRCASHEYDAVHQRVIVFVDGLYWIVADALRAPSLHDYALNFQLGPEAQGRCAWRSDASVVLDSPQLAIAHPLREAQTVELAEGWVSARYGHKQSAPAWRCHARGRDVDFDSVLLPWRDAAPAIHVADVPASGDAGEAATALRIAIEHDGERRTDLWFHARGAEASMWHIGAWRLHGRWLHVRLRGDGGVLMARSHAGAGLHGPDGDVDLAVVPELAR